MTRSGVGGVWSQVGLGEAEEVEVDAIVGSMSVARTVARGATGGAEEPHIGKATQKLSEDSLRTLLEDSIRENRATVQLDTGKLRALGVIETGESRRATAEDAPQTVPAKVWAAEQPPVSSIELDRSYETALADKKLVVETAEDEEEEDGVTIPIGVIHEELLAGLTVPIPRNIAIASLLPGLMVPPVPAVKAAAPAKKGVPLWTRAALGVAGIAAIVTAAIVIL